MFETLFNMIVGSREGMSSKQDTGQLANQDAGETEYTPSDSAVATNGPTEVATLGGGCFWCVDELFRQLRGVVKVESGYAGGDTPNPSYSAVCCGATGHAEVVQVTFDPTVISYRDLLEVFFTIHDPTTMNRQGADAGTQYRSIVLHHTPEQCAMADAVIADITASRMWERAIVTELAPFTTFYPAEASHQEYYSRNPRQQYCQVVIAPKVAKFRKRHLDKLRA